MNASSMDRLLEAERSADSLVKKAREEASSIVEKAREDMRLFAEKELESARKAGRIDLDAATKQAEAESERIRNEGIGSADATLEKGRAMVPAAVNAVVEKYLKG